MGQAFHVHIVGALMLFLTATVVRRSDFSTVVALPGSASEPEGGESEGADSEAEASEPDGGRTLRCGA
eukprot:15435546-Alexandrium_andersonii.AAC.1